LHRKETLIMARPKQASDEQVLQAAHRIYAECGHQGFTLSQLARELGLSRAAIIQRFDSAEALRMRLARERIANFRSLLEQLPAQRSGDALLSLATFIGGMVGSRPQLAAFMQNMQTDLADDEMVQLEKDRGEAMLDAISVRMPETAVDKQSAALAFRAHISGTLLQWQVEERPITPRDFLVERTREWLRLAGIPFSAAARGRT
jgi:TetR/AcrR family transcriptional regulator, macrolide resistance operon repressor